MIAGLNKKYLVFLLLGLTLIFLLQNLGFFEGIDNYAYDLSFRLRGVSKAPDPIVIVAIDEKSLESLGRWPINRRHYARLVEITDAARAICFDVIMSEESPDDRILVRAINNRKNVVLPVYIDKRIKIISAMRSPGTYKTGHVHLDQGIDGVVRKAFHTIYLDGSRIPSISSVLYEMYTGKPFPAEVPPKWSSKPPSGHFTQSDPQWINYYGPSGSFTHLSLVDVLNGAYSREFFHEKIVLVGITATGIESETLTPFSQKRNRSSGVEVHANILGNLLEGTAITPIIEPLRLVLCFILACCAFFLFVNVTEKKAVILWIVFVVLFAVAGFFLFIARVRFPPSLYAFSITYIFILSYFLRLDDAFGRLNREYENLIASLRWIPECHLPPSTGKGFFSLLTPGGINSRIKMLDIATEQLLFEKNLVDATLTSSIYGIMLFDAQGRLRIANGPARKLFADTGKAVNDFSSFRETLLNLVMEGQSQKDKLPGREPIDSPLSFTLSLMIPEKTYVKMDVSDIIADDTRYRLLVFSDITAIKDLELKKGEIVSVVSHELKQPLSVVLGYSELITLGTSLQSNRDYAQNIFQEAQRMARMINLFLNISRLESGKFHFDKTSFDPTALLHGVVKQTRLLAEEKKTKIILDCSDEIGHVILDRDILYQCIFNVIENAIKYCPEGSTVTVKLEAHDRSIEISISDNGKGIDSAHLPYIFDKFYRVRSDDNKHIPGSGLGLAFVNESVQAMGGSVTVESTVTNGTTFRLSFPLTD